MDFRKVWEGGGFGFRASIAAIIVWIFSSAQAAPIAVNDPLPISLANGLCSISEAIHNANDDAATNPDCPAGSGADTIQLAPSAVYSIPTADNNTLEPTGLPLITSQITIEGNNATLQRGGMLGTPLFRVLLVTETGNLTLNDLTVRNGRTGSPSNGGFFGIQVGSGIRNFGTLTLNRCTIRDNRGETYNGGGIASSGSLTITAMISCAVTMAMTPWSEVTTATILRAGAGSTLWSISNRSRMTSPSMSKIYSKI